MDGKGPEPCREAAAGRGPGNEKPASTAWAGGAEWRWKGNLGRGPCVNSSGPTGGGQEGALTLVTGVPGPFPLSWVHVKGTQLWPPTCQVPSMNSALHRRTRELENTRPLCRRGGLSPSGHPTPTPGEAAGPAFHPSPLGPHRKQRLPGALLTEGERGSLRLLSSYRGMLGQAWGCVACLLMSGCWGSGGLDLKFPPWARLSGPWNPGRRRQSRWSIHGSLAHGVPMKWNDLGSTVPCPLPTHTHTQGRLSQALGREQSPPPCVQAGERGGCYLPCCETLGVSLYL